MGRLIGNGRPMMRPGEFPTGVFLFRQCSPQSVQQFFRCGIVSRLDRQTAEFQAQHTRMTSNANAQLRKNLQALIGEHKINRSGLARRTGIGQTTMNRLFAIGAKEISPKLKTVEAGRKNCWILPTLLQSKA